MKMSKHTGPSDHHLENDSSGLDGWKGLDAARLPRDPATKQPLPPRAQPGYYPGFSTLGQQAFWDEATRAVVRKRVEQVAPISFFSEDEARVLRAVCDRVLPQDDRTPERRIPIVNVIDERLSAGRIEGYRYDDMPPDGQAYRLAIQGIEAIAHSLGAASFVELSQRQQDEALKSLHDGKPLAGDDIWRQMNVRRFWLMLVTDCTGAYYAHPWAWDEIGFGGPAYPRGYMRLRDGQPEPWETRERRYAWEAPEDSLSDHYESLTGAEESGSYTPGTH
ncbi:MAG TPA: gluconate 2-dehydrogenase subunit 3 family protein [Ktedonobacterales bacterium]